ncbi:hypothetical protein F7725_001525 [Dissostichus mawsoni]|uniref:tRNA (guanine-N(7)-)-methyltransferase non-catalytic subunit WDR4 n=1 Tax=Dissostichus mawsoni TaxID=36200 RepID=A0A7J5XZY1_DISMA|nr:hypothetical protein F7725_001525 [Dissostichus mawsoni]
MSRGLASHPSLVLPSPDTHSAAMPDVGFCGEWFIFTCDKKLVAIHTKQARESFVFDCSTADKKPNNTKDVSNGWVVRRCTSLMFSQAEDQLLATDKSGDVYSFSVGEPQREGELKMGHLSMLLAMSMSPDDKFIITADRDEKIRVSHLRSPFVSALLVPPGHPHWLLSGSGDGTMKLWDYESGRKLQSWDLKEHEETPSSEADKQKKPTVCRISCSPDARHVAVQCERASTVHFFTVDQDGEEKLVPHRRLSLPHCPLDMTFDPEGQLWVLMDSSDAPLQIYTHRRDSWESDAESPELIRVTEAFKPHWETLEASLRTDSRFEHLYKVNFDNVAAYLQKKQQRLEEQLKRGGTQKANSNKKARKEKL